MTEIKIKRLSLENFKCHKNLTLDFMGGNASIYGDNATGKTSIYDALTWLLFGKDSSGNGEKNIEIKPLDKNGDVRDHDALTSVEAVLLVNGEETTLRRTYKEVWTTRRGSSQAVFDGNTSEYYIDGVPCKRNAFQDKVNELVSEETFRMLTSVSYFAKDISWQERRAVLFKLVGVQDDKAIMATDASFQPLLDDMGRLSLEDYKKKLLSEKRSYTGAKTEIPARISECQKTIEDTLGIDFEAAKAEAQALQDKKDGLAVKILAIEHNSAADQKRNEIRAVQLELTALEHENRAYRASQSGGLLNIENMKLDLSDLRKRLDRKRHELANETAYISDLERKVTECRNRWIAANGEEFSGGTCPTCGQNLPAQQLQEARARFDAEKQKRMEEILQTANSYKEAKKQAEARSILQQEEIYQREVEIAAKQEAIANTKAAAVEPKDMDGYAEKWQEIKDRHTALSGELAKLMENAYDAKEALRKEMAAVDAQLREKHAVVQKESLLAYAQKRIEELRQDAKRTAECLEKLEKMLYLIDEYTRYKTRFVEDSINGMFRIARFRLFREQANGGIEDRCDVVLDGVPYLNINNGAKINVGIDIINTLSQAYGVKVPLFIDNAESVTSLEPSGNQIIRLVVSEDDKELRANYEN